MRTIKLPKKKIDAAPARPVLERAEHIVAEYRIVLERDPDGGFIGSSVEIPTVFADGVTVEECVSLTRDALLGAVVTMLECGDRPPSRGKRDSQVNVRMTVDEKMTLLDTARRLGFRGISEFIRSAALERSASG